MTQIQKDCNTAACSTYGLDGINFGTKTMREIMDASDMGHGWAQAIMKADQANISNYQYLNPNNGRANLYGAIQLGIAASRNFSSSDDTVKKTLAGWLQNLNKSFPATNSYTPASLGQRIADIEHAAQCIGNNSKHLASIGELTAQDFDYLTKLTQGLDSYAAAARKLLEAVKAGPCIDSVTLNIPANKH